MDDARRRPACGVEVLVDVVYVTADAETPMTTVARRVSGEVVLMMEVAAIADANDDDVDGSVGDVGAGVGDDDDDGDGDGDDDDGGGGGAGELGSDEGPVRCRKRANALFRPSVLLASGPRSNRIHPQMDSLPAVRDSRLSLQCLSASGPRSSAPAVLRVASTTTTTLTRGRTMHSSLCVLGVESGTTVLLYYTHQSVSCRLQFRATRRHFVRILWMQILQHILLGAVYRDGVHDAGVHSRYIVLLCTSI